MRYVRTQAAVALFLWVLCAILPPAAQAEEWERIERQFRGMPMEARRLTGPLFWLHNTESDEKLAEYLEIVKQGHNGTFCAESRPHTDWLGPGWYHDLGVLLDKARELDLSMWIFDEKWWPSGEVGGDVPPKYGAKTMQASSETVEGPEEFTARGYGGEHFIAALAGRQADGGLDGDSLVDLSPYIHDGTQAWDVPDGSWKIMKFTWKYTGGHRILVDGASQRAVDWYLDTVYQPHYDHFKDAYGKTIKGYFYDEPETPGDWGTEVIPLLKERGVDWKKALAAWKFQLTGEEQTAARYQYQDAFAETWGRTLYGGITEWCHDHDVKSIGHFLEHKLLYLSPHVCAGNMFQLQKYSDMGGIDAVFDQFVMGKRNDVRDSPMWETPKIASSISHVYNKKDDLAMVEIYGARGQDLTYYEMKWWADRMQVCGVNFMITHSFNPKSPYDTDCPPYFYNSGYEPRWPLYRVWADYNNRLSLLLHGGRHVCPVAFLFLGNSHHVGKSVPPEQMSTAMQDALLDCDWMPYPVFEKKAALEADRLKLYDERYRVLVVPPVEVIPRDTMVKIREFFQSGGVVVGYNFLPTKSATLGHTSDEIAELREDVWGDAEPSLKAQKTSVAGGRSYLLPAEPTPQQIRKALVEDAEVTPTLDVVEGNTDHWVHVLHRVKNGRDVFLVVNQNHEPPARTLKFRAQADGVPERWDAMRNEITELPFERIDAETVEFELTLKPNESTLIVFSRHDRDLPRRVETLEKTVRPAIDFTRVPLGRPQPPSSPPPPGEDQRKITYEGCNWVWFPGENAASSAPPGTRSLRTEITLPDQPVESATFLLSVDNGATLYVNGTQCGQANSWQARYDFDITSALRSGANVLAVEASNASNEPNPAGVIGKYVVRFESGVTQTGRIDTSWRSSKEAVAGWKKAGFDDSSWKKAEKVAPLGGGPWGHPGSGRRITPGPYEADYYRGECVIPEKVDLRDVRVVLEMEDIPRNAASVELNGQHAGGVIGGPLRLEVTELLEHGKNTLEIAPAAPASVRLKFYEGAE